MSNHFQKELQPTKWKQELPTQQTFDEYGIPSIMASGWGPIITDHEDEITALRKELAEAKELIAMYRESKSCLPGYTSRRELAYELAAERTLADRLAEILNRLNDAPDRRSSDEIHPDEHKAWRDAWRDAWSVLKEWKEARNAYEEVQRKKKSS